MILSQSTDRTSSHSASFYLLFLTLGIFTTKGNNNNTISILEEGFVFSCCKVQYVETHLIVFQAIVNGLTTRKQGLLLRTTRCLFLLLHCVHKKTVTLDNAR